MRGVIQRIVENGGKKGNGKQEVKNNQQETGALKVEEDKIKSMKNNLNALAGASQQCDLFIKQIEDKGEPMPPEKAQALEIATS